MNEMMTITCIQCGREFEFSIFEQQDFSSRGFDPPKRCPECRRKKFKNAENRNHPGKKKHYRLKYEP